MGRGEGARGAAGGPTAVRRGGVGDPARRHVGVGHADRRAVSATQPDRLADDSAAVEGKSAGPGCRAYAIVLGWGGVAPVFACCHELLWHIPARSLAHVVVPVQPPRSSRPHLLPPAGVAPRPWGGRDLARRLLSPLLPWQPLPHAVIRPRLRPQWIRWSGNQQAKQPIAPRCGGRGGGERGPLSDAKEQLQRQLKRISRY